MNWTQLPDQNIIDLILLIRHSEEDQEFDLIEKLEKVIAGRKIKIKYENTTGPRFIYLTPITLRKLKSYLLNRGESTDSFTAEYIEDIFVDSLYSLELYELK